MKQAIKKSELEKSVFKRELSKIPEEFSKKLKSKEKKIKPLIDLIIEKVNNNYIGFYIKPDIEFKNGNAFPNFDKITLCFVLNDFERPILEFKPEILLGEDFEKYLEKKIIRNNEGDEEIYLLKGHKDIKFTGTSISLIRESCFESVYEPLKEIGNSIVYSDPNNLLMALKTIEIHKNMVLSKFERYVVVYAGVGSWIRGEYSNDFDVFFVIDDTDVRQMPRYQVKERLSAIIYDMAFQVSELTGIKLHIQTYLLTDFWESLKDAHPVIFTFLRDGVPFYDRGLFNSWKELLKLGKIRPSPEAIDMHMNVGYQLLESSKNKFREMFMENIYYAVLNPSQAVLMLKGYNPTTPKETVHLFKEILLKKEKIITKSEYEFLNKVRETFKKLEHNENYKITGKDIDNFLKNSENFLKKIKKIFENISEERTKESILNLYNEIVNQLKDIGIKKNYESNFKNFIEKNGLPDFTLTYLKSVIRAKKDYENKKITVTEVNKVLKEGRTLLSELKKFKEEKIIDQEKSKILIFEAGNKKGELFKLKNNLYLIYNSRTYLLESNGFKEIKEIPQNYEIENLELTKEIYNNLVKLLKTDKIKIIK